MRRRLVLNLRHAGPYVLLGLLGMVGRTNDVMGNRPIKNSQDWSSNNC